MVPPPGAEPDVPGAEGAISNSGNRLLNHSSVSDLTRAAEEEDCAVAVEDEVVVVVIVVAAVVVALVLGDALCCSMPAVDDDPPGSRLLPEVLACALEGTREDWLSNAAGAWAVALADFSLLR